jgi:hypothetical protein
MQPFLNGLLIGSVVWSIFVAHKLREAETRLDTLETTTTADWYSNAQDDAERSERLEMLEALKSSAIHYGDAATIRVVQGDVVSFGRWVEPKEGDAK